jgi:hypothetical protein
MVKRTPSYCLHKATGQAVVRIDGKDSYLGKYGTPDSQSEYNRLVSEVVRQRKFASQGKPRRWDDRCGIACGILALGGAALRDADGNLSRELENMQLALKPRAI